MSKKIFSYKDFDVEKDLGAGTVEIKKVGGPAAKGPEQKYKTIPLFGVIDDQNVDLLIEGPEFTTTMGISTKKGLSGKDESSIMQTLPRNEPAKKKMHEVLDDIHAASCCVLQQLKAGLGGNLAKINWEDPKSVELIDFRKLVWIPMDKVETDKPDLSKQPVIFIKLYKNAVEETNFYRPTIDEKGRKGQEKVPWSLLTGSSFSYIPLYHVKSIYIGQKPSIQIVLKSAVITSAPVDRSDVVYQTDTLETMAEDKEKVEKITDGVRKIKITRQSVMETQMPDEELAKHQGGEEGGESHSLKSVMSGQAGFH